MKRIIESENTDCQARLINARRLIQAKKTKKPCNFRLYTVNNKDYTAKGLWIDNNKIYRDRIKFRYYSDYSKAKLQALKIIHTTSEICVSIENISKNVLYIVYKDKTIVLRVKYSYKAITRRQAISQAYKLIKTNGGSTIEKTKGVYKITSYK